MICLTKGVTLYPPSESKLGPENTEIVSNFFMIEGNGLSVNSKDCEFATGKI